MWKAIETAPRDGTPFLACVGVKHINGSRFIETHVVRVDEDTGEIDTDFDQGWSVADYDYWMPLPKPPEALVAWQEEVKP
jgi:hypothetical protein